jgi:hypothetical protein
MRLASASLGVLFALSATVACGPENSGTGTSGGTGSDSDSTVVTDSATSSGSGSGASASESASGASTTSATDSTGQVPGSGCTQDNECAVLEDCCSCGAFVIADGDPGMCNMGCDQSACSARGLDGVDAACRLGQCRLEAVSCDPGTVLCDAEPPACAQGKVARVVDGCWGQCVDARHCDSLSDCSPDLCGDGWMCVKSQTTFAPHCEPMPAACDGEASCGCVGAYLDEFCMGGCMDGGGEILCADGG